MATAMVRCIVLGEIVVTGWDGKKAVAVQVKDEGLQWLLSLGSSFT